MMTLKLLFSVVSIFSLKRERERESEWEKISTGNIFKQLYFEYINHTISQTMKEYIKYTKVKIRRIKTRKSLFIIIFIYFTMKNNIFK